MRTKVIESEVAREADRAERRDRGTATRGVLVMSAYVIAGYAVTVGSLGGYAAWVIVRLRAVQRRAVPDDQAGS